MIMKLYDYMQCMSTKDCPNKHRFHQREEREDQEELASENFGNTGRKNLEWCMES